jgi:hypothetical protein
MSADLQYHVTLRHPVNVKMHDESIRIIAFDAVFVDSDLPAERAWHLKTHMLYSADLTPPEIPTTYNQGGSSSVSTGTWTMSVILIIPPDNIAGMVAQPFRKGR